MPNYINMYWFQEVLLFVVDIHQNFCEISQVQYLTYLNKQQFIKYCVLIVYSKQILTVIHLIAAFQKTLTHTHTHTHTRVFPSQKQYN